MIGSLVFTAPWLLLGLAALPLLYLLIRAVPPPPKRQPFPAMMLLKRLDRGDPPPKRTPPWLLLLRLLAAGLVILALAGPLMNPAELLPGRGPVLVLIDDGWTAASRFDRRREALQRLAERAARADRGLILVGTAPPVGGWPDDPALPPVERPAELMARLPAVTPKPFGPDPARMVPLVERLRSRREIETVLYLSDGLAHDGSEALLATLAGFSHVRLMGDPDTEPPVALLPVDQQGFAFDLTAVRPAAGFELTVGAEARGSDGRLLATADLVFPANEWEATARLDLPRQLRNDVARIALTGAAGQSAGTSLLLDRRAYRPVIGLSDGDAEDRPLQSQRYFLTRALEPFAEIVPGEPGDLVRSGINILVLADVGRLADPGRVEAFVEDGGLLIRFAGPSLIEGADRLLPVALRARDRSFGGALSWEQPQRLTPFPEASPFFGLPVDDEIVIDRQVLARPGADVAEKSWALLSDGTPVVTGERRGRGWIVLFHTTANADWSTLPLTGLFLDMLRRLFPLAETKGAGLQTGRLAPRELMDGYGRLSRADGRIGAIAVDRLTAEAVSPQLPPGLYGSADQPLARNLMDGPGPIDRSFRFTPLDRPLLPMAGEAAERDLKPWLLALALILVSLDLIASLTLRGQMPLRRARAVPAAALALLLISLAAPESWGADRDRRVDEDQAVAATSDTRIAYVRTGDPQQDRLSEAGLEGLRRILTRRTAVRLGPPQAVDPATDELAFYPLIYWPVRPEATALETEARARVNAHLRTGGIILFDTGAGDPLSRSQGLVDPQREAALRRLLGPLDTPRLIPVTQDHVLSKSFYLLDRYPGRIVGRPLWVSHRSEEGLVSPLIVGGGDWAGAWAVDDGQGYLEPNLPQGERQRELAYRFGVNLVMYALTGTYKDDNLHLSTVLRRLRE